MITNEKITKIIDECSVRNYDIKVRDISYILLCMTLEDKFVAYKAIFGISSDRDEFDEYESSDSTKYLRRYLDRVLGEDDITFEENKSGMVSLLEETKRALENNEIKKSDALKIQADLRVKLNDKFAVTENNIAQYVVVNQKYQDGDICPYCSHEIARRPISKEEAMEMYDLVEK